ncbi:MAG: cell wall metabolism sensor histidine kinase WalK [Clostridia bacterium]|nr:cell wall metabolism sensor histidine kinase WalK [Clostridia bacterium]
MIILAVGIIPSAIIHVTVLKNYEERAVSLRISDVQNQCKILSNHLFTYNYLADTSADVVNSELEQLSNFYDGRIMVIDSSFRVVKDTYALNEGKTIIAEEVIKSYRGEFISHYDEKNHYIEMTIPINDPVTQKMVGVMLTSVSTDSIVDSIEILGQKALILEMCMAVIIVILAYILAIVLLKPFTRIIHAINEVKDGYTEEEISVPDYLETESITDAFNQMLARMKVLDTSRQEFVSNVSHELKTPLTSMKVLADSLIDQEDVPVELYREFMSDIAKEIDRENTIINDLLSLVKMDKTASVLNIESRDIDELLENILKRLQPIAEKKNIELVLETVRDVTAEIDEVKFTLALTNLIENAIKYNIDNGWVHVRLDADHQFFTIEISDSGIGIPEEAQGHIFERFYRVDKSHSTEIDGTGLGLAITRNAILMHRGSIKVASGEEVGTVFTVKCPLNFINGQGVS